MSCRATAKSIIAGTAGSAGADAFGLTRYNADGSLDTTFGTNGATQTPFAGDAQAAAEILLANGDILIAGTVTTLVNGQATGSQFALAEYTSAGALDTTFADGAGFALASFSSTVGILSNDIAHALAIGPDGTIYVGGSSDANGHGLDFAIAAYAPSGSPSPAFGADGKQSCSILRGGDDSIALPCRLGARALDRRRVGHRSFQRRFFRRTGRIPSHRRARCTKFGVKGKVVTTVGSVDDAASSRWPPTPMEDARISSSAATAAIGSAAARHALWRISSCSVTASNWKARQNVRQGGHRHHEFQPARGGYQRADRRRRHHHRFPARPSPAWRRST